MLFKSRNSIYKKEPLSNSNGIPIFSVDDRYISNYKKIASDHLLSQKNGKGNPFIEEELWQILEKSTRDLIKKYSQKGKTILDAGVGMGRVLGPLNNLKRYGIDISLDYLEIARKNGINVAFSKIEDMPYKDSVFDFIVVSDVLEHVFNLHQCCSEILRVLRPGGILVVRVPFKEDLTPYLSKDLPYEFVHLRSFDEASLRLLFEKIFDMQFVEAAPVSPYLQGMPRLRVQLLSENGRATLQKALSKFSPHLNLLEEISKVTAEEFMSWIYDLRDNHPFAFKAIENIVVWGIEINIIFKK